MLRSIRSRLIGLVLATVVPFLALIGVGLWDQWRSDQAAAIARSVDEARLLAAQVDDHLGNVENLLIGLSRAVSWDAADIGANDALLAQIRSEQPDFVGGIGLFAVDGTNIGTSSEPAPGRSNASSRAYFQEALAGRQFAISDVIETHLRGQWVVSVATAVRDGFGEVRAVLAIGTRLEQFQDAFRMDRLPRGSVVRVVNEKGIVVAQSDDPLRWIGRNLSQETNLPHGGASAIVEWPDGVKRITASTAVHRAPWLVSVGLPADRRSLQIELRRAFEHDEFELHFQPRVRLVDQSVVGAEALIRWRHRERGIILPGVFIETLGASTIAPEVRADMRRAGRRPDCGSNASG